MVKLLALAIMLTATAANGGSRLAPNPTGDMVRKEHASAAPTTARVVAHLSPEQKAWFARAVERILQEE